MGGLGTIGEDSGFLLSFLWAQPTFFFLFHRFCGKCPSGRRGDARDEHQWSLEHDPDGVNVK